MCFIGLEDVGDIDSTVEVIVLEVTCNAEAEIDAVNLITVTAKSIFHHTGCRV